MRILLVEDNPDLMANVTHFLETKGFVVDCARDGRAGLHLASSQHYDLIVLDIMLPGLDGYQVCMNLREVARSHVPILMLTARDTLEDRLHGLKIGADDYLIKPFALSELVARIEAIVRRATGAISRRLKVGDLTYDADTMKFERAGIPLKLSPQSQRLLVLLMQRSPAVVRREVLEEAMWGDDCPDSDSLRSHIHMLRQVVDKPFPRSLIHTHQGVGYRLAEIVDEF